MADILISTANLTKKYGNKTVVRDVSIEIEQGGIIGLVGQNGAGKTTLIRLLTGLAHPTSGSFQLLPGQKRNSTDVAAIVERPSIYTNLSAMDNLVAQSMLLGLDVDAEYLTSTLKLVGLNATSKQAVKNYSLGMKQRLAIAMTLVGKPQLLLLDEPTNGLDPQGIADMRNVFIKLNKELGVTILISSHILSELGKFATEFYFMDSGRIIKKVSADEIKNINGRRVRLNVEDTIGAIDALKDIGDAKVCGNGQIMLSTEEPITQVMLILAKANIAVTNIAQSNDALEDYYLQLIRDAHKTHQINVNGGSL